MAAQGGGQGNEDDEVYAVAQAVDDADDVEEPDYAALAADKKRIEPLPVLDHASIEYDSFAKDFYEEASEVASLQPSEVSSA